MLATPPGLEPMPRAQDSVPRTGALSRPVKTMSRKTVPVRKTSQSGSCGARSPSSGSIPGMSAGMSVLTLRSPVVADLASVPDAPP